MPAALKWTILLVLAAISIRLVTQFFASRQNRAETSKVAKATQPADTYFSLRNQILQANREPLGLPAPTHPTDPWAVVMDWPVDNGTATVVAISDGTASVYLSSGGGFIGGGESHEPIRKAARNAVSLGTVIPDLAKHPHTPTNSSYPLPHQGEIIFYALTDAGIFTASAPEADLSAQNRPLAHLANALQEIITQYRLTQQK
jgi:hypothetical protein